MMYRASDKPIIDDLRDAGWRDYMIEKYLDYKHKRESTVRRGRTAYKDSTNLKYILLKVRIVESTVMVHVSSLLKNVRSM